MELGRVDVPKQLDPVQSYQWLQEQAMALKTMQFVAIVLAALALIPAGAHFFELPHKIGMTQEQYFTVQSIYRGWSLFGIPMIGAIVVTAILAIIRMQWGIPMPECRAGLHRVLHACRVDSDDAAIAGIETAARDGPGRRFRQAP